MQAGSAVTFEASKPLFIRTFELDGPRKGDVDHSFKCISNANDLIKNKRVPDDINEGFDLMHHGVSHSRSSRVLNMQQQTLLQSYTNNIKCYG